MTEEKIEKVEAEKIEQDKIKGDMMDVGPGVLSAELPCGYIDEEDELHGTIMVSEMTGYEEDIMAGKGPIMPRLNHVIANCTKCLGSISDKNKIAMAVSGLTAPDRMLSLIAIRRVSLGDFYNVKVPCPSCKDVSRFPLDLSEVEIVAMPNRKQRIRDDELTTGRVIRWHIMRMEDEEWLIKKQKKKEDVLTLAMLARVDEVDGEKVDRNSEYRKAMKKLKALTLRERTEIRHLFEREEGSVNTEVEFECPSCGHEWNADMDVTQIGFFFPSGT